ncbi:rhodanese-like domain-containing protein [Rubritalea spongiae]|uniref:Rhodanese-like domain-containing protein n=1 Tax=Rubritalea spongiae TaxID=430797 RepID=A0ABW5E1X6_9BACT
MKVFVLSVVICTLVSCSNTTELEPDSLVAATQLAEEKKVEQKDEVAYFDKSLITGVEVENVFELRETGKVYLIDTRSSLFFNRGHIAGAMNIPLKHFDKIYSEKASEIKQALANDKVVVIYCASAECPDSYEMATRFAKKGIATSVFKGGWQQWQQTGLE